jgi:hypothetical protein
MRLEIAITSFRSNQCVMDSTFTPSLSYALPSISYHSRHTLCISFHALFIPLSPPSHTFHSPFKPSTPLHIPQPSLVTPHSLFTAHSLFAPLALHPLFLYSAFILPSLSPLPKTHPSFPLLQPHPFPNMLQSVHRNSGLGI